MPQPPPRRAQVAGRADPNDQGRAHRRSAGGADKAGRRSSAPPAPTLPPQPREPVPAPVPPTPPPPRPSSPAPSLPILPPRCILISFVLPHLGGAVAGANTARVRVTAPEIRTSGLGAQCSSRSAAALCHQTLRRTETPPSQDRADETRTSKSPSSCAPRSANAHPSCRTRPGTPRTPGPGPPGGPGWQG